MDNYLSLQTLSKSLSKKAGKLDKGKLGLDEINEMLEESRDLYERITILRYKALVEKKNENREESNTIDVVAEEEVAFSLNFDPVEEEVVVDISPNQKNLLDEIQEIDSDDKTSLNDKYASTSDKKESVGDKLKKSKIKDLRKGIALNQKFLFMNDLFQGEKELYDLTIDKLNGFETLTEAKAFLASDISKKFEWNSESNTVDQFISILERRFI